MTISSKTNSIIFDMDGVITDTMPFHFRAWRKVFAKYGINVSKYDVYSREGQKGADSIQEIFAAKGVKISISRAKEIIASKEALYKRIIRKRYIPGSRSLIRSLQRAGFKLALVTGTMRDEVKHTLTRELLSAFSVIITGSDVKKGKPNPEPYLKALKKLKISSTAAIVIENAPFGILSAKSAGIRCFAICTSLPSKYLNKADRIFKNHSEIRNVILGNTVSKNG
ncbi:MAG: HAD family phosphatase [Candidatus Omnitrophica bacterium]|nr:HAD family phosphatase [Candidatus Omnitrophota bacterium]